MRFLCNLWIGLGAVSSGIVVLLIFVYNYLPRWLLSDWEAPPRLAWSISPTKVDRADFLSDSGSFAGQSFYFYARDRALSNIPLFVGGPYASDGSVKMRKAVWSKDGSILAIRAAVSEVAGHGFSKYYDDVYVDAYDFRHHKAIKTFGTVGHKHRLIQKLLLQRGGSGKVVFDKPYASWGTEVSKEELKVYRNQDLIGGSG